MSIDEMWASDKVMRATVAGYERRWWKALRAIGGSPIRHFDRVLRNVRLTRSSSVWERRPLVGMNADDVSNEETPSSAIVAHAHALLSHTF